MRFHRYAYLLVCFTAGILLFGLGCKSSKTKTESDPDSDSGGLKNSSAAKRVSRNNLKQLVLAMQAYHDNNLKLPAVGQKPGAQENPLAFGTQHSWRFTILPYIEQSNLYNMAMQNPQAQLPDTVTTTPIKVYQHPAGDKNKPLQTHYRVFVGNGAAFEYGRDVDFRDFADGVSNTILIVEAAEPVDWSKVEELEYDPKKPLPKLGVFDGGFLAAMGDGTIRWIPADTDEKIIRAMITRNGGEAFEMPGKKY